MCLCFPTVSRTYIALFLCESWKISVWKTTHTITATQVRFGTFLFFVPLDEKLYLLILQLLLFSSVCRSSSYRTAVLEMFPNIKVLDGKKIFCLFILLCIFKNPFNIKYLVLHWLYSVLYLICLIAGERVVGRGSDLYQLCKDIDDTIKGMYI